MSYNEIVERLAEIEAKVAPADTLDGAIETDWFLTALEIQALVRDTQRAIADERAREAAMITAYEERQDAMADLVSANWGHD